VTYLRQKFRIVGSFIGSLPGFLRQNSELGLPLLLMPEEAKLLVEKGIAIIVTHEFCVNEEIKQFYDQLKCHFYRQNCEQFKSERKLAILQNADQIIAGKIKKFSSNNQLLDNNEIKAKIIQQEIDSIPDISPESCAKKLYTSCPLENRVANAIDWNYPQSQNEIMRYAVFKEMWEKGYYLTEGFKFGSDFLAYQYDPIGFHSKYLIICKSCETPLSELELQTYGRLSKSVRKIILIAIINYLQNDKTIIEYKTINWQTITGQTIN
jgi:tRNA-splicing endonuclease subunit Sen34